MKQGAHRLHCLTGGVLLVCAAHSAAAASLRARAVAPAQPPAQSSATTGAAAIASQHHSKLDVGFSDFERNLTSEVVTAIQGMCASDSSTWQKENASERLVHNVTETLKTGLKAELAPLKLSIGKTWMALPEASQKDAYVQQLKTAFTSVFASSMRSFHSHLDLSIHRIENEVNRRPDKGTSSPAELLASSEQTLGDSLVKEHCYDDTLKTPKAKASPRRRFCIQSMVGALAHRLNDTQGLISMTMRFEAGAMSLAQKQHKEKK